ncbi:MAG: thiamine diphosphokinase [Thermotogaceae bacterium]|nr:thiamine diphosphokinase [Thermotogaceae bacterium]
MNGLCSKTFLKNLVESEKYEIIIGVDGGTKNLLNAAISPDVVIGDMDSMKGLIHEISAKKIIYPEEKDEIDSELAIEYCREKKVNELHVVCWKGERVDMEYALLMLLSRYRQLWIKLLDEKSTVFFVNNFAELNASAGEKWSVLPIGGDAVVTLKGFKYEINKKTMPKNKPYGVSNVAEKGKVVVRVHEGGVVVVRWKKNPL